MVFSIGRNLLVAKQFFLLQYERMSLVSSREKGHVNVEQIPLASDWKGEMLIVHQMTRLFPAFQEHAYASAV